jgi:hypothetical protein
MAEERGCGERAAGGIYLETAFSDKGHPLECFYADPAMLVATDDLGVTPRGVTLLADAAGVTHVWDWVGSESYPNVADFLEEAKRLGISRRISRAAELDRLTRSSRIVILHARAIIEEPWGDYLRREEDDVLVDAPCPQRVAAHHCGRQIGAEHSLGSTQLCDRYWYHDVTGGDETEDPHQVSRTIGSTQYVAYPRPAGITPRYSVGIVGIFPIARLAVIADPVEGSHEESYAAAKRAGLPVIICPD